MIFYATFERAELRFDAYMPSEKELHKWIIKIYKDRAYVGRLTPEMKFRQVSTPNVYDLAEMYRAIIEYSRQD